MVPAEFLGLTGARVDVLEQEADGSWSAHVRTAADVRVCCPGCGGAAGRVKESAVHTFKHVVMVPVRVTWHKSRFLCEDSGCGTAAFTEAGTVAGRREVVSPGARSVMGHLVGDWLVPVSRVAAGFGVGWHTAHDAFAGVAADAQIVTCEAGSAPDLAGAQDPQAPLGTGTEAGGPVVRRCRSVSGVLPPVRVLGIDDHRRGRPLYHRDPATGGWVADADRWQSVFVDSAGGHGLLGQVEGRAGLDVIAWLSARDPAWLEAIRYVTIDMSSVYKSAVTRSGLLPNAKLIVDLFHVVQLANKMVADVRRRVTFERYGRRGRATDPEYTIKGLLMRGQERLSKAARHKLLCALADLGEGGRQIGAAWRAKELLRDLVKLSPNQTGLAPTRPQIAAALEAFYLFCHTVGGSVPEIGTLAETISLWRSEIARGVATGYSNAAAEGVNRLVKLVYRTGFSFTNVTNQQRRSRYAASRGTRPTWAPAALPARQPGHPSHPVPTPAASPPPQRHLTRITALVEAEDPQLHTATTRHVRTVAA